MTNWIPFEQEYVQISVPEADGELGSIHEEFCPAPVMYWDTASAAAWIEQGVEDEQLESLRVFEMAVRAPSRAAFAMFCFRLKAPPKSMIPRIKTSRKGKT